jgi:hypothetical protein
LIERIVQGSKPQGQTAMDITKQERDVILSALQVRYVAEVDKLQELQKAKHVLKLKGVDSNGHDIAIRVTEAKARFTHALILKVRA